MLVVLILWSEGVGFRVMLQAPPTLLGVEEYAVGGFTQTLTPFSTSHLLKRSFSTGRRGKFKDPSALVQSYSLYVALRNGKLI